jgi:hypothetical protein
MLDSKPSELSTSKARYDLLFFHILALPPVNIVTHANPYHFPTSSPCHSSPNNGVILYTCTIDTLCIYESRYAMITAFFETLSGN